MPHPFSYCAWSGLVCAALLSPMSLRAQANDWPQFLGPQRNGSSSESLHPLPWSKEGPPVLWQLKVGQGFAGPIVAQEKLFLFHRQENQEVVECLSATNGARVWKFSYPTPYVDDFGFDEGPRATPVLAEGRLYTFGAAGMLHCLDSATGQVVWSVDCAEKFGSEKGFFGAACSPLVEGSLLLLNLGGHDKAGIVALKNSTGELAWKATEDGASYASPVMATFQGRRYALFFTQAGVVLLDPATGSVVDQFPWRAPMRSSVNAATPLVLGDSVFISASYQAGAVLLRFTGGHLQKVWSNDDSLSNHYATSVAREGFLYGFHGRQEQGTSFRCVEAATGKVRWSQEGLGAGSVLVAGKELLVLTERGELIRLEASPEKFQVISRAQVMPFEVRAMPALANGLYYARSKRDLVCLDLRGKKQTAPGSAEKR